MKSVSAAARRAALVLVLCAVAGCVAKRVPLHDPGTTSQRPPYDFEKEARTPAPRAVDPAAASARRESTQATLDTPQPVDLNAPAVSVQDLPPAAAPSRPSPAGESMTQETSDSAPAAGRSEGASSAATTRAGYRVQLFATTDRDSAERLRREVESRLGEKAYLDFAAPYYKVRVGNCPSSEACRALEARLRQSGYNSIWTVPAQIEP